MIRQLRVFFWTYHVCIFFKLGLYLLENASVQANHKFKHYKSPSHGTQSYPKLIIYKRMGLIQSLHVGIYHIQQIVRHIFVSYIMRDMLHRGLACLAVWQLVKKKRCPGGLRDKTTVETKHERMFCKKYVLVASRRSVNYFCPFVCKLLRLSRNGAIILTIRRMWKEGLYQESRAN